jgi:hypothetical protein
MPNVSVKLSMKEYRDARIWCARNDTCVSIIVREIRQNLPLMSLAKIQGCSRGVIPPGPSTTATSQTAASAPASPQLNAAPAARVSAPALPPSAIAKDASRKTSRKAAESR